jgi:hypothetical protein
MIYTVKPMYTVKMTGARPASSTPADKEPMPGYVSVLKQSNFESDTP